MLSDEEKKAIEELKNKKADYFMISNLTGKTLVNLIEKQSKEIEELSDKLTEKICKGVEEEILEEYRQTIISKDRKIEEYKKQLDLDNECEIALNSKVMDLEKEIEELKDSNNKLYNILQDNKQQTKYSLENNDKKWEDKIKAKIEEVKDGTFDAKIVLQSFLEKE